MDVFADPIRERATAVLVAHNHPSGNLLPSREDRDITARLKEAGGILGIGLLDHLIFSQDGFYSFLEHDIL
jgi:DNA repair protein RadC